MTLITLNGFSGCHFALFYHILYNFDVLKNQNLPINSFKKLLLAFKKTKEVELGTVLPQRLVTLPLGTRSVSPVNEVHV